MLDIPQAGGDRSELEWASPKRSGDGHHSPPPRLSAQGVRGDIAEQIVVTLTPICELEMTGRNRNRSGEKAGRARSLGALRCRPGRATRRKAQLPVQKFAYWGECGGLCEGCAPVDLSAARRRLRQTVICELAHTIPPDSRGGPAFDPPADWPLPEVVELGFGTIAFELFAICPDYLPALIYPLTEPPALSLKRSRA